MSDQELIAFQKSIASEPEDDASRLVFADFLDEQDEEGYSEMAAFIRADIELSQIDEADVRYPEMLARVRRAGMFTSRHRIPWLSSVPNAWVSFHRGLISGVMLSPEDHLKHEREDWQRLPIEQLHWVETESPNQWNRDLGESLSARPELERVTTLLTAGRTTFLTPLLCECPFLTNLQALSLDVGRQSYGESLVSRARLAHRMSLPSLSSLRLHGSYWPAREWRVFVDSFEKPLSRLILEAESDQSEWYEHSDIAWLDELERRPTLYGWAFLYLTHNQSFGVRDRVWNLGDPRSAERAAIRGFTPFEGIELSNWNELRCLHLEMGVEGIGAEVISDLEFASQLEWLSSNDIHEEQAESFAQGTKLTNLRRLSLHTGESAILQGEYCKRLHRLDWGNISEDLDLDVLLETDLPELRWLTLYGCDVLETLTALRRARKMPNLCTLVLEVRPADASEAERLLNQLATNADLPHLSLVGIGWMYNRKWWILSSGNATPAHRDVDPIWRDWFDLDPSESWS